MLIQCSLDIIRQNTPSSEGGLQLSSEMQVNAYMETTGTLNDVIQFCIIRRGVWPELSKYALSVLSIQATEVPCDRVFSWASAHCTDERSQLAPDILVDLLTVYSDGLADEEAQASSD